MYGSAAAVWENGLLVEWRAQQQQALFIYNVDDYHLTLSVRMRPVVFGMKGTLTHLRGIRTCDCIEEKRTLQEK